MLDVIDLSIEFQDHLVPERVVHHVNLHMEPGEIVGLVGESGSGDVYKRQLTGSRESRKTSIPLNIFTAAKAHL